MPNLRQITLFFRDGQVICNLLAKGEKFLLTEKMMYQDILFQFSVNIVKNRLFDENDSDQMGSKQVIDDFTFVYEEGQFVGALVIMQSYISSIRDELKHSIQELERMNKSYLETWKKGKAPIQFVKYFENLRKFIDDSV